MADFATPQIGKRNGINKANPSFAVCISLFKRVVIRSLRLLSYPKTPEPSAASGDVAAESEPPRQAHADGKRQIEINESLREEKLLAGLITRVLLVDDLELWYSFYKRHLGGPA